MKKYTTKKIKKNHFVTKSAVYDDALSFCKVPNIF